MFSLKQIRVSDDVIGPTDGMTLQANQVHIWLNEYALVDKKISISKCLYTLYYAKHQSLQHKAKMAQFMFCCKDDGVCSTKRAEIITSFKKSNNVPA